MTSEKQIISNKKNALESTGPKTIEGKEIASKNSIKHGILTKEVYISTGEEIGESYERFKELEQTFWDQLQPVGIVEEMLVDRLFSTVWRLKRLLMAENGFIGRQTEGHFIRYFLDQYEKDGLHRKNLSGSFFSRLKTHMGCLEIARMMDHIARAMEEHGKFPMPEWIIRNLDEKLGAREGFMRTECISIIDYAFHHRDNNPITEEEEKKTTKELIQEAKDLAEWFSGLADVHEWNERDEKRADLKTKMIPPFQELEKIQRYETALERSLFRTLHELQRVQSARLGHPAPLAAALDVTVDSDLGSFGNSPS